MVDFDISTQAVVLIATIVIIVCLILVWLFRRALASQPLNRQLMLAITGVSVLSLALVIGAVIWQTRSILTAQTGEAFLTLAASDSQRIEDELVREVELLQNLAKNNSFFYQIYGAGNVNLGRLSADERREYLLDREQAWLNNYQPLFIHVAGSAVSKDMNAFIQNFPAYNSLAYIDEFGALNAMAGETAEHYYYGDQEWWDEVWSDNDWQAYIGNLQFTPGQQDATVDIFVPVQTPNEEQPRGIVRARYTLSNLGVFVDDLSLGDTGEVSLIDNTGLIFYNSNPDHIGEQVAGQFQQDIANFARKWGVAPDNTGQTVIHSHAAIASESSERPYLDNLNWTFTVQQSTAEALATINSISQLAIGGGLVALIVTVIAGTLVSRQITHPIVELTNTVSEMISSPKGLRAKVYGPAELRTLATAFNDMTNQLEQTLTGLEERVAARTQRLETVTTLSERLVAILDFEQLLVELVNQVKISFGYYHAHVYILDDSRQNLVMTAGAGEAGRTMKARGHSIRYDASTGLVARAARTGQIVWVDNVREAEDWLPNPLLPETYSEMAVPIILEEQVVGVLDVQEDRIAGFDKGDASVLRLLANQVAVAIRNARLFANVETALAKARSVQDRYLAQAWENIQTMKPSAEFSYRRPDASILDEAITTQLEQEATTHNQPVVVTVNGQDQAQEESDPIDNFNKQEEQSLAIEVSESNFHNAVVAPIKLQNQVIGTIQLHQADQPRQWDDQDLALIQAIADQVAQTAENLRLFEETRQRASREQTIREITDKLRVSPNLGALLETAARELGQRLGVRHTVLELGIDETDLNDQSD